MTSIEDYVANQSLKLLEYHLNLLNNINLSLTVSSSLDQSENDHPLLESGSSRADVATRAGISKIHHKHRKSKTNSPLTIIESLKKISILTGLSLGIFPSASSFALACRRFRMRLYCFALTYSGSSSKISAFGRATRWNDCWLVLPGTIYITNATK